MTDPAREGRPPSNTGGLSDRKLLSFVFATRIGNSAESAGHQIAGLFRACEERLGLTEVSGIDSAAPDPYDPSSTFTTVRGRRRPSRGEGGGSESRDNEAWWDNYRDVACISVMLSADGDSFSWPDRMDEWSRTIDGIDLSATLGMAHVFTASYNGPSDQIPALMQTELPPGYTALGAEMAVVDGPRVRRINPAGTASTRHAMLAVSSQDEDEALGELVWTRAPDLSAALPLYLLNAVKLDFARNVFGGQRGALIRSTRQIDQELDQLRDLVRRGGLDPNRLSSASGQLARLTADTTSVAESLINLRRLRRTVTITSANMAAITGALARSEPSPRLNMQPTLTDADRRAAQELIQDIDDQAEYLDAAVQRTGMIAGAIDRELAFMTQATDRVARNRQELFGLLQTAIVGAALMALTAVQAFGYHMPIPGPAQPAIIAALGTATLWLSAVVLRMAGPVGSRSRWRSASEIIACGLFGASIGWLATAVSTQWTQHSAAVTVSAALLGLASPLR